MKPAIVFPINDPLGVTFPHLKMITPLLKQAFERAYISLTANTRQAQPEYVSWVEKEPFFIASPIPTDTPVGRHFHTLFSRSASECQSRQVLHLCFIDRLAYALQSAYRKPFLSDVASVTPSQTPLNFQRSEKAWHTHPANYRDLENMLTRAGELLFGKSLEFAWCHLALTATQLDNSLEHAQNTGMSMMAEMLLPLIGQIQTRHVDWLAWEDAFILGRNAATLKSERENDPLETRKRLDYVVPMLQAIASYKNPKGF